MSQISPTPGKAPTSGAPPSQSPAGHAGGEPVAPGAEPTTTGVEPPAPRGPLGVPAFIRRIIRERREIERTVQVTRKAARFLFQSQLPRMAAALSYRTIFGLVPTLVIAIAVLGSFATEQAMQSTLRQLLIFSGISEIVIDEAEAIEAEQEANYTPSLPLLGRKPTASAVETLPLALRDPGVGATSPPAPGATSPNPNALPATTASPIALPPAAVPRSEPPTPTAPSARPGEPAAAAPDPVTPKLEDWITEIVSRVRGIAFEAIGAIGVLTLIYAAISMLIEVERSFNDIYHAPAGRAWGRRIPLYWTMLTLGVILILATFFVGARATAWLAQLSPSLAPGTGLGTLLTFIATVLTSMVLLLGVYIWVPNTRVAVRPALAGAFVAALLWETGKLGLQRYIEFSANYAKLYGSLGLLPLLLIWVYVTWLIVLFGLQVAYALQHFQSWRAQDAARDATPSVVEPAAILAIASQIARGFDVGKPRGLTEIASGAGVDERVAELMVERLVAAGVALRTEHPRDAVTLARPAETIALTDLLRLGYAMVATVTGSAADLREQSLEALAGRTLAGGRKAEASPPPAVDSTPVHAAATSPNMPGVSPELPRRNESDPATRPLAHTEPPRNGQTPRSTQAKPAATPGSPHESA